MPAINLHRSAKRRSASESGATAVEFVLLALIFFTFAFGIMEVTRLLYVFNTLQEVTRRAAAAAVHVDPKDTTSIAILKRNAVFRNSSGPLLLAPPVTDGHVQIDYLRWDFSVMPESSWPDSPAQNKQICMINPHASRCIRFVEARICNPGSGSSCAAVTSQMLLPLIDLRVSLPKADTIATIETLGYIKGTPPPGPPPCGCP